MVAPQASDNKTEVCHQIRQRLQTDRVPSSVKVWKPKRACAIVFNNYTGIRYATTYQVLPTLDEDRGIFTVMSMSSSAKISEAQMQANSGFEMAIVRSERMKIRLIASRKQPQLRWCRGENKQLTRNESTIKYKFYLICGTTVRDMRR